MKRSHSIFFVNSIAAMAVAAEPTIEVANVFASSNVLSVSMSKKDANKSDMIAILIPIERRRTLTFISFDFMIVIIISVLAVSMFVK